MTQLARWALSLLVIVAGCSSSDTVESSSAPQVASWSGAGYFARSRDPDLPAIDLCFGDLIGDLSEPDYVTGCVHAEVVGIDFESLDPWRLGSMDVVVAQFEARIESDRHRITVISWRRLDDAYVELKPRLVVNGARPSACNRAPSLDFQALADQGFDRLPLAIVLTDDSVSEVTAVGVDQQWFEIACDAGAAPEKVYDFLSPTS